MTLSPWPQNNSPWRNKKRPEYAMILRACQLINKRKANLLSVRKACVVVSLKSARKPSEKPTQQHEPAAPHQQQQQQHDSR